MSATRTQRLGLVGLGQFGRFAAGHLRERFEVLACDARPCDDIASRLGIRAAPLAEVAACPILVVAVPIQAMEAVFGQLAPLVRPGTLVCDVGSVKQEPVRIMRSRLSPEVEILGTHPMFGPQSAADGLAGHRIVLCPERTTRLDAVRTFLEGLGLEVIVTDAETHDRQAAWGQALPQLVGRAVAELEPPRSPARTRAAELLRATAEMVGEDSWELFAAIQTANPHAAAVRKRLIDKLRDLEERLTGLDDEPGR